MSRAHYALVPRHSLKNNRYPKLTTSTSMARHMMLLVVVCLPPRSQPMSNVQILYKPTEFAQNLGQDAHFRFRLLRSDFNLRINGGGQRNNVGPTAKRKKKLETKPKKRHRTHGWFRPHIKKHEDERKERRERMQREALSNLNLSEASNDDQEHAPVKDTNVAEFKPLRLGETTVGEKMNKIHQFRKRYPQVFEEESRFYVDNHAHHLVKFSFRFGVPLQHHSLAFLG